ncbi:MAG: hypothetical protein MW689_000696 [Thermodesulfobacteria bacterium]|nr:hypothetical protein [Thermodesulfobacteriota bacterium]MCU4138907.1 hypothetical protein [Thermodesulfobacteriota bacterium]
MLNILLTAGIFKAQISSFSGRGYYTSVAKIKKAILVHKDPKYIALKSEVDQRNITL